MKRTTIFMMIAATLLLGGCAARPAVPLRYVAVDMPAAVPVIQPGALTEVEVERRDWGGFHRSAQDAGAVLKQLSTKAGQPVLQNADLRLETAPCYLVVCIGRDVATAGGGAAPR